MQSLSKNFTQSVGCGDQIGITYLEGVQKFATKNTGPKKKAENVNIEEERLMTSEEETVLA